jgi:hypothetical protein
MKQKLLPFVPIGDVRDAAGTCAIPAGSQANSRRGAAAMIATDSLLVKCPQCGAWGDGRELLLQFGPRSAGPNVSMRALPA